MECVHCQKRISTDTFDAHRREHAKIQAGLKRPTGRTFGARYQPKEPSYDQDLPSKGPKAHKQQTVGSSVSSSAGPSVRINDDPIPSHQRAPQGLDKRIHFIIESFPPYDGDGVEAAWLPTAEFKCKDCTFKFRTKKECDEHYLSQYCHGASIVVFGLTIDKSRPCGYRVKKEILPLDGSKDPSRFQCHKCPSTFASESEVEDHQKSHLVSPSRCLHCQKMFSTNYELEDHYDWHDDMDYRQRMDALGMTSTTDATKEPKDTQDDISNLASGMKNMSLPLPADLEPVGCVDQKSRGLISILGNQELFKDGEVRAISCISAEDVEQAFAPEGYYVEEPKNIYARPDGTCFRAALGEPVPDGSLAPTGCLVVMGHGKLGSTLHVDVSGRKRWLRGAGARVKANRLRDLKGTLTPHIDAAEALEERGQLLEAMESWIKALDALSEIDLDKEELKVVMLTKISALASRLDMFEVGVEYTLRALELSVKFFSKDSINCFYRINDLAVFFDKAGMLNEAAYLYRRSLHGRLKINGPNNADTLMTMQELASVSQRLGKINAARFLLEQSYIGHENLKNPDEKNTMGTLNNLAATYSVLGYTHAAVKLLESAIPRMSRSLGLGMETTCGAVCNLLSFTRDNSVAAEVSDVIRDLQENMTDFGSLAVRGYADFLARNRRLGEAVVVYQKLYDWNMANFGPSEDKTIQSLHRLARCLESLNRIPEAVEALQQLADLAALSPDHQDLHRMAVGIAKELNSKKKELHAESKSWGLDKPGRCGACGKSTLRLCSNCQMKHFCSSDCQTVSTDHNFCYPSVTPAQSISIVRQPIQMDELQDMFRASFACHPMVPTALRLVSSEGFFIDPACFATFRVWKDPTKFVSYYFTEADTRIAIGNNGSMDWQPSQRMGTRVLFPSTEQDPLYLLVAPGENMFSLAKYQWESTTGAASDIQIPNLSMIEYLQSKEPRSIEMQLAVVMCVWEI